MTKARDDRKRNARLSLAIARNPAYAEHPRRDMHVEIDTALREAREGKKPRNKET